MCVAGVRWRVVHWSKTSTAARGRRQKRRLGRARRGGARGGGGRACVCVCVCAQTRARGWRVLRDRGVRGRSVPPSALALPPGPRGAQAGSADEKKHGRCTRTPRQGYPCPAANRPAPSAQRTAHPAWRHWVTRPLHHYTRPTLTRLTPPTHPHTTSASGKHTHTRSARRALQPDGSALSRGQRGSPADTVHAAQRSLCSAPRSTAIPRDREGRGEGPSLPSAAPGDTLHVLRAHNTSLQCREGRSAALRCVASQTIGPDAAWAVASVPSMAVALPVASHPCIVVQADSVFLWRERSCGAIVLAGPCSLT